MKWYLLVLKRYAVFNGRARRKEYWMFFLFNVLFSFVFGFIGGLFGVNSVNQQNVLSNIYTLVVIIPSIAVAVRRMHDIGKPWWFFLIPIYNIVLAAADGDQGDNEYGPDPKEDSSM